MRTLMDGAEPEQGVGAGAAGQVEMEQLRGERDQLKRSAGAAAGGVRQCKRKREAKEKQD